jgi:predicted RNA-binding protein with PUA-like domain
MSTTETISSKIQRTGSKFLLKSEPDLPIQAFVDFPSMTGKWDGIRNYQARNIQREMRIGDHAFFYHSNINKRNGIYGVVEIVSEAYDDVNAFDPKSKYYDPKAKPGKWLANDIRLVEIWDKPVLLSELNNEIEQNKNSVLSYMMLFKMSRLSTQRVSQLEWDFIMEMRSRL